MSDFVSLMEDAVQRIPVRKEELEEKLGVSLSHDDDDDDDDNTNTNDQYHRFPGNNTIVKACCERPSSKKSLYASLQKWIPKWSRTQQDHCGIKVLSLRDNDRNRNTSADGPTRTSRRLHLDQYVRKVAVEARRKTDKGVGVGDDDDDDDDNPKGVDAKHKHALLSLKDNHHGIGGAFVTERSPLTSLALYHPRGGALIEGEIHCHVSQASSSASSALTSTSSSSSVVVVVDPLPPPPTTTTTKTRSVLQCAASLYYQLWYFRTILKKDVSRAYGFSVATTSTNITNSTCGGSTVVLWVTLMLLEKPSTGLIGGRYAVYEYTQRHELSSDIITHQDPAATAAVVWDELSHFLRRAPDLPCPLWDTATLGVAQTSPGYMLLPHNIQQEQQEQQQVLRRQLTGGPLAESPPLWQVLPTITGSLVIRCQGPQIVRHLLHPHPFERIGRKGKQEEKYERDETTMAAAFVAAFERAAKTAAAAAVGVGTSESTATRMLDRTEGDEIWYLKLKTPPFGPFWDTAKIAINGTRSLLLLRRRRPPPPHHHRPPSNAHRRIQHNKEKEEDAIVQEWLWMYPIDSHITQSCAITIMRSVGIAFTGADQLSWEDFQQEFASLMRSTLHLQRVCNTLIHGDINEGNILYDDRAKAKGRLLKLIDWDEALRSRPCQRQISSHEERLRYPAELISFPEQYTKQQLLHVFQTLVKKYYSSMVVVDDCRWEDSLQSTAATATTATSSTMPSERKYLLTRAAVDARFKALLHFLESTSISISARS